MSKRYLLLCGAAGVALLGSSSILSASQTYTDAVNDTSNGSASEDISTVVVSNDSTNLTFVINFPSDAGLITSDNYYGYYQIGIQTAAGGSTNTTQNPYYNPIGISTGMTDFIGSQLGNPYNTGLDEAYVYQWEPSAGAFSGASAVTISNTDTSVTITVPLASLGTYDPTSGTVTGIAPGDSFNFDVWSTYSGSGNSAYDALDNPNVTPGYVGSTGASYDAATAAGSTFSTTTYTVSVPEPTSLAALTLGAAGLLLRRRRL